MTLRDPGSWLIKTVISLAAISIPVMAALGMPGAERLFADTWGGLTVFFGMLLGIKGATDIGKQAVAVQVTKITGEAPPPPAGDPPATEAPPAT